MDDAPGESKDNFHTFGCTSSSTKSIPVCSTSLHEYFTNWRQRRLGFVAGKMREIAEELQDVGRVVRVRMQKEEKNLGTRDSSWILQKALLNSRPRHIMPWLAHHNAELLEVTLRQAVPSLECLYPFVQHCWSH